MNYPTIPKHHFWNPLAIAPSIPVSKLEEIKRTHINYKECDQRTKKKKKR